MGTIRIPDLLEGILEATAAEAAAKARISTLRAALEDEARRRYVAEGAAPSWAAPALGKVRLEPEGAWTATIADPAAFGSWVAEHYPTEATVAIHVPAADAADVLSALEFINVTPIESRVEVRSAWEEGFLDDLIVDVDEHLNDDQTTERTITISDTDGQVPDGLTATRKPAKLVVSLDRERRTAAITEANATATALLEDASGDDTDGPDLALLDVRRRALEALNASVLSTIAKGHGLSGSGTKAELAERIARAEQASGHVISIPVDQPVEEVLDGGTVEEVIDRAEEEVCGFSFDHDTSGPNPYECRRCGAELEQPEEELDSASIDTAARARMLLDGLSREVLRGYAKSIGISAAGTKGDLLDRLLAAGTTVGDVNDYSRLTTA